jgi:hypothetical protein
MTSRSSGSEQAPVLSPEHEAFASWFVKWWHRQGRHIDFSANVAPADQKNPSAVSEIEIRRLDVQTERGTNGLEPAPTMKPPNLQAKSR